jgi:large-conductance mechanosensitive channel
MEDSSRNSNHIFNVMNFVDFLSNNNVFAATIAAVLSDRMLDITNTFVEEIIMAVINRDADNDGKSDLSLLQNQTLVIYGMKFGVGKLLLAVIKFIVISYVIYIVSQLLSNFKPKQLL